MTALHHNIARPNNPRGRVRLWRPPVVPPPLPPVPAPDLSHPSRSPWLFHRTALDNLPGMLAEGLLSRDELVRRDADWVDVADRQLVHARDERMLGRFVPFHFRPLNPFAHAVHQNHPGTRFVVLCVPWEQAVAGRWRVSPTHPMSRTQPPLLPCLEGYARINWRLMDQPDPHAGRDDAWWATSMAEALCPDELPSGAVGLVLVQNWATFESVRAFAPDLPLAIAPAAFPGARR